MPTFARACDVYQGYNYKKDKQTPVGFLLSLKIGDTTLTADQTCKNPMTPTDDVMCVAVLSNILWETGVTDAFYLSGQVTAKNRQAIALLAYKDMTKVDIVFKFAIYDYDLLQKQYYLSCTSDSDLNGILEKNGNNLNLAVAEDPSDEVQSPLNYSMQIGVKPQPSAQSINIATSVSDKLVKSWGVTVTA